MIVANKIYAGSTEVDKVYLGSEQIYPSGSTPDTGYSSQYLTTEILTGGTITISPHPAATATTAATVYYSINNGQWTSFSTTGGTSINATAGDKIRWKSTDGTGLSSSSFNRFYGFAKFNVYGNIMSLAYGDNFSGQTTIPHNYCFKGLFYSANVVSAENLILPATTLTVYCYDSMFTNCTLLTTAPTVLPAATVMQYAYSHMFNNCTSLTTAPAILSTTIRDYGCRTMFEGCSSLNYVKCLATSIGSYGTYNWLSGVAASGTFVKAASMADWTTGNDGIPSGWTVEDAA